MNTCFCVGSRSSQPAARCCFSHTKRPRRQLEPRAPLPKPPGLQMETQQNGDGAQQTGEFPACPFSVGRLMPRVLSREERKQVGTV